MIYLLITIVILLGFLVLKLTLVIEKMSIERRIRVKLERELDSKDALISRLKEEIEHPEKFCRIDKKEIVIHRGNAETCYVDFKINERDARPYNISLDAAIERQKDNAVRYLGEQLYEKGFIKQDRISFKDDPSLDYGEHLIRLKIITTLPQ